MPIPSSFTIILAALASLWAAAPKPSDSDKGTWVVVWGESAHSFEEAKEDALRKAVEMAGGKIIKAETQVRNFALVHDTIISRAVGYVRQYQQLAREEKDGIYRVRVRALVTLQKIRDDCGFIIEMIIHRQGRPDLLVVCKQEVVGDDSICLENPGEFYLRDLFDKVGFDLVDDEMLDQIGQREKILAEIAGDWRRAAAVAAKVKADYVVTARAVIRVGKPMRPPYPGLPRVRPVTVSLSIKAVAAETAALLASKTGYAKPPRFQLGRDPDISARRGLKVVVEEVGRSAMYRMLEHWARELDQGQRVVLTGTRIPAEVLTELARCLRGLDGVTLVRIADPGPEVVRLKVITRLKTESLASELKNFAGGRLKVTAVGALSIEFKMSSEKAPPPLPKRRSPTPNKPAPPEQKSSASSPSSPLAFPQGRRLPVAADGAT